MTLVLMPIVALLLVAQPAAADKSPQASVCVVAGRVDVSPGVGSAPPASSSAGTYVFDNIVLVCVGTVFGDANLVSTGGTGLNCGAELGLLLGSFCGPFDATGFESGLVNGNGNCTGTIGGPQLVFGGGAPPGRWSVTFGQFIAGSIDRMYCRHWQSPLVPHYYSNGIGVLAAVAEPDPRTANILGGGPVGCAAPTPGPAGPALLYFCGLIVEGVAVIVQ